MPGTWITLPSEVTAHKDKELIFNARKYIWPLNIGENDTGLTL